VDAMHYPLEAHLPVAVAHHNAEVELRSFCILSVASRCITTPPFLQFRTYMGVRRTPPSTPEHPLIQALAPLGCSDYLWLKNAKPAAANTTNATSKATANGIRITSAALPIVVLCISLIPTIDR